MPNEKERIVLDERRTFEDQIKNSKSQIKVDKD